MTMSISYALVTFGNARELGLTPLCHSTLKGVGAIGRVTQKRFSQLWVFSGILAGSLAVKLRNDTVVRDPISFLFDPMYICSYPDDPISLCISLANWLLFSKDEIDLVLALLDHCLHGSGVLKAINSWKKTSAINCDSIMSLPDLDSMEENLKWFKLNSTSYNYMLGVIDLNELHQCEYQPFISEPVASVTSRVHELINRLWQQLENSHLNDTSLLVNAYSEDINNLLRSESVDLMGKSKMFRFARKISCPMFKKMILSLLKAVEPDRSQHLDEEKGHYLLLNDSKQSSVTKEN